MVTVKNLSFTYGGGRQPALSKISLEIQAGEFVLLCGPSGCGKTTLLRLLKPELAPYGALSGEIRYDGALQRQEEPVGAGGIGYVMQNPENQVVTDQVLHELAFGLENLGIPAPMIARRIAETAAYFGIHDWLYQDTASLSGGQKQILNLAACMVCGPKLLLLDEPTAMLDPIAADTFIALLRRLNEELGITVLVAEHHLEALLPIAHRVVVLEQGRIVFNDHPRGLAEAFSHGSFGNGFLKSMPAAFQIHQLLGGEGTVPLTVREGKNYLTHRYQGVSGTLETPAPRLQAEEPLLYGQHLYFRYDRHTPDLLQDISLRICPGDFLCVVGGNGVGKSTLLKVLSGVCKPYKGKVIAGGRVAMLPQNPKLVFLMDTVQGDYEALLKTLDVPSCQWESCIQEVAQKLGILPLLSRHPYDLSGGEQQKAALGKLLLCKPRVLLLDEPTKGLDANAKQRLSTILHNLRDEGTAIVMVTHDLDFCGENATKVALLSAGQWMGEDTPNEFFSGNHFYTTAAARIGGDFCKNAITPQELVSFLRAQGERLEEA